MTDAHVLVVDDEPELQELVRYNLAKAGYDVSCAGSGEEDDDLTKPFSPRVLLARVKAALRRSGSTPDLGAGMILYEEIHIHPGHREVRVGADVVHLTPTEFNMLHMLSQRPGWVFTRYQIVDHARGNDAGITERSVDVHMTALRRKRGSAGAAIEIVRGIGYRLRPPSERV